MASSKRWRIFAAGALFSMAVSLLPVAPALAGSGSTSWLAASGKSTKKSQVERALTVTGLGDNQTISGTITFDVEVGQSARTLYVYSQLSPFTNDTSYSWGTFDARKGVVHVSLDTALLPDGMHMVTLYTRDTQNHFLAMGAFSVYVQNWLATNDVASHFDWGGPNAFSLVKGNAVPAKLRDLKTGKIARYEYHLAPLGFPYLIDAVTQKTGSQISQQVPIKGLKAGWYVLTVYAYDSFDQIIDKSAVTLQIQAGK